MDNNNSARRSPLYAPDSPVIPIHAEVRELADRRLFSLAMGLDPKHTCLVPRQQLAEVVMRHTSDRDGWRFWWGWIRVLWGAMVEAEAAAAASMWPHR